MNKQIKPLDDSPEVPNLDDDYLDWTPEEEEEFLRIIRDTGNNDEAF